MKIKKYRKLKDNRYVVSFDDIEIKVYDDVIIEYDLLRKKELSDNEFNELVKRNDNLEAYYKVLKYITKKIRSEKEIVKYLSKDYDKVIIDDIVNKLKKENYIDDLFFMKCYINDRLNLSNDGPNKIKKDLISLGILEEDINNQLSEIDNEKWFSKIELYIQKKIKVNHQYGMNRLRDKILFDLSNLGYYKWMVEEVLSGVSFNDKIEILDKEYDKYYKKLSKKYEGSALEFQLKNKLIYLGFNLDDINEIIQNKKTF